MIRSRDVFEIHGLVFEITDSGIVSIVAPRIARFMSIIFSLMFRAFGIFSILLLKAEMELIQQQMVEAKKNERANVLKEVKRLCKEFGFTAEMLEGGLELFRVRNAKKEYL